MQQEFYSPDDPDIAGFMELLLHLREYHNQLGLTDEPDETIQISFSTDTNMRPIAGTIPVYSQKVCTQDDMGYKHMLYNLKALADFEPPEQYLPH